MQFKSIINTPCSLQYFFAELQLHSSLSRQVILESEMMCDSNSIEQSYKLLKRFFDVISKKENSQQTEMLQFKLCELKDIRGTLKRLSSANVLDDIELFEIKHLALLASEIKTIIQNIQLNDLLNIPDMEPIISILDPDGMRMATFYIYDSYSEELRELRSKIKQNPGDENLFVQSQNIEDNIRIDITKQLSTHHADIEKSLAILANIDINLAKSFQIKNWELCFPKQSEKTTKYKSLFNPEVKEALEKRNSQFQKIDIDFSEGATVITGANMGGKTIVLKTLTLCQYLYQFGFGIPAAEAEIEIKDEIYFCIGDEQSELEGLSSFAAEMKKIDSIIKATAKNNKILALIDEPARTTNPVEGTALVSALIKILQNNPVNLIITTHYNISSFNEKRLRVKGLENGKMNYTLIETHKGEVPHEALNIAQSLDIDNEWLKCAKQILDEEKN